MRVKVIDVIYGKDKNIGFRAFDFGKVLQAIAYDLQEFGQKGVQGVRVGNSWKQFIDDQKARTDLQAPYVQAGVINGSLVLIVRDAKNKELQETEVLVKDYDALKKKLAANTMSVTNINPESDRIIDRAAKNKAAKFGEKPDNDPRYGEITGNIVLVAHGVPQVMPKGRLLGRTLGKKTPEEIVALLITPPDPKKRIGLDYNGTLTLCGCFTASGGAAANHQDDVFAKRVADMFHALGYEKISVVGYPGAAITSRGAGRDTFGNPIGEGDELVEANIVTIQDQAEQERLDEEAEAALRTYEQADKEHQETIDALDELRNIGKKLRAQSGLSNEEFLKTSPGKKVNVTYRELNKLKKEQAESLAKAKKAVDAAEAAYENSGLGDQWAKLEGRFGLRTVN